MSDTSDPRQAQVSVSPIDAFAAATDTDVIVYLGKVEEPADEQFQMTVAGRKRRRKNVSLLLATYGGSGDSAYRISRCLQRAYVGGTISVLLDGACKSAGTLIAIGAHELVMSDRAELGPLDVQMGEPDDLANRRSGLTAIQALQTLQATAFDMFEDQFLKVVSRSQGRITTRTAAEIATRITIGLFSPIYQQIDPMRLGENDRAIHIADAYGRRLARLSGNANLKPNGIERLIAAYPSHGFVIDREEASELFVRVREPSKLEMDLLAVCAEGRKKGLRQESPSIAFLNQEPSADEELEGVRAREDALDAGKGKRASGTDSAASERSISEVKPPASDHAPRSGTRSRRNRSGVTEGS